MLYFYESEWWCGVGVKADCLNIGPRPIGKLPSVGVFLRDPSPYLREFLYESEKSIPYSN